MAKKKPKIIYLDEEKLNELKEEAKRRNMTTNGIIMSRLFKNKRTKENEN